MERTKKIRVMEVIRSAEGGMMKHYMVLVNGLIQKGFEVTAICDFSENQVQNLKEAGAQVIRFSISDNTNIINGLSKAFKLSTIIKNNNIDIVHCHGFKAGAVGRLAAFFAKCPSIYTIHNFIPTKQSRKLKLISKIERILFRITKNIIVVSRALKKHLIHDVKLSPNKISIIYNGVEPIKAPDNSIRKSHGIREDTIVVVTVARLIPSKGIDFLLDAIPIVVSNYSNIKFIIIGDGPDKEKLQNKVDAMREKNHIIMTGYVDDIKKYYNAMDIFVLPTLSEGLGISVLEAMSAGKAVIATSVGGIPEIIRHRWNGYLIAPENKLEIANAIMHLIRNNSIRNILGDNAFDYVVENFNIDNMIQQTAFLIANSID